MQKRGFIRRRRGRERYEHYDNYYYDRREHSMWSNLKKLFKRLGLC